MPASYRVESLLAARLFLSPQLVGERLFFISDLSGRLSLYAMDRGGSIPEPLLPRDIALQNPLLMDGESYFVFPALGKALLMIDRDGDENYQPTFVPLDGGTPEHPFGDRFTGQQVVCLHADLERNLAVFAVDNRRDALHRSYLVDLEGLEVTDLGSSLYGNYYVGANSDYSQIVLADAYTEGDEVLYLWRQGEDGRRLLVGKPLDARLPGETVPLTGIRNCYFTAGDRGLLFITALFDDRYGLGYLRLDDPSEAQPVRVSGASHQGIGEIAHLEHLEGDRYQVTYNIDGVSHAYEGSFDESSLCLRLDKLLCGSAPLSNGVLQRLYYERASGDYAAAFSTAISPTQLYTIEGPDRRVVKHTRERVLGIPESLLAPGEDASYVSHDGLRISARLYLPSPELGFDGPRPVIFYIHGGPQGQERPDFAWFSMPLIQYFALNGFVVFVPNVRGSTGYGLDYAKRVDHDWGGQDRLDHVSAFEKLRADPRLDMGRVGVIGRSYGGYMTLTLVGRHPELWKAACDMFGPYNMLTFLERLPETWRTYFYLALGHPERDHDSLVACSPSTYLHQLACPLFVIQGRNDPRVTVVESGDLVEALRAQGKQVDFLVFDNEGHDVIKFENKVSLYTKLLAFLSEHLLAAS